MADQKRVATSYDSGDNNTAKAGGTGYNKGDWGNQPAPQDLTTPKEATLEEVMEDFDTAREYYKANYLDKHQDQWKCYNSMRTRRGYDGIADDFVPETFTIAETVKANIAGGKPKFNFLPLREEQKQDTTVLNNLMDFYWDQNRMGQKVLNWVQDMFVLGNGVLMVSWEGDLPRIQNIPLADFFFDPTATHLNNPEEPGYARYAGYRYLTTRDELRKKKIVNPGTGEMDTYYKNIDQIPEMAEEWDKLDKQSKEMFMGSTVGEKAHKKQVECIVYYTKEKKVVIANRKVVIYEGKNPYFRDAKTQTETVLIDGVPTETKIEIPEIKPFLPFAVLRNYVDASLFLAKGDVEVILPLQEALNDLSNQKRDNITFVLNNMWQIDPQFAHLAEQIESIPGAVYPIPKGALAPLEKQIVTGEADAEMMRIKDEMRRATAADEAVQGVSSEKGRVTATEVQAQLNQASQRFATKLQNLEQEGYAQLGRILFKMVQIFVDNEMAVRVLGPAGTAWRDFDPNEYTGEYEPKVQLESTTKAVKAEEGQKYVQVHQVAANSPHVNQKELMRVYFERMLDLPEDEIKTLLDVPAPPVMPGMEGAIPGGNPAGVNASGVPAGPLPLPAAM